MTEIDEDDMIDLTVDESERETLQITFYPGSSPLTDHALTFDSSGPVEVIRTEEEDLSNLENNPEHKPNYFVPLTVVNLENYIEPGGILDTSIENIGPEFFEYIPTLGVCSEKHLAKLVHEIESTGICSFDTENKEIARLIFQIGSINGTVLCCRVQDIPSEIRNLLENSEIYKVQNMVSEDVTLLYEAGITVRNVIESQVVYMLYVRSQQNVFSDKTGCEAQCNSLGFRHYPYRLCAKPLKLLNFGRLPLGRAEVLHAAQDVRVPLASLIQAVSLRRKNSHYPEMYNSFLPQILEICHNVADKYLFGSSVGDKELFRAYPSEKVWQPVSDKTDKIDGSGKLSDLLAVAKRFKNSRYYEPVILPPLSVRAKTVSEQWVQNPKQVLEVIQLPSGMQCRKSGYIGENRCRNCAREGHNFKKGSKIQTCPEIFQACRYPLCEPSFISIDGTKQTDEHSIITCKTLHTICTYCQTRGHFPEAHNKYSPRELVQTFLRFSHLGLFTCLPYLLLTSRAEETKPVHFRANLYNSGGAMESKLSAIYGLVEVSSDIRPFEPIQKEKLVAPTIDKTRVVIGGVTQEKKDPIGTEKDLVPVVKPVPKPAENLTEATSSLFSTSPSSAASVSPMSDSSQSTTTSTRKPLLKSVVSVPTEAEKKIVEANAKIDRLVAAKREEKRERERREGRQREEEEREVGSDRRHAEARRKDDKRHEKRDRSDSRSKKSDKDKRRKY